MKISIQTNFPEVMRKLDLANKQARYAAAVALTRTAQDVRTAEREEMAKVFDRPTRYTLNSLYLRSARKDNLTAEVWLKDDRAGSGTPATRYLLPQIEGGERQAKGFERLLQRAGVMPEGMLAVPASGVRLDRYGNVSKGLLNQILSQLRLQLMSGYESRATGSTRSRRTVARQGVEYFALSAPRGKLLPGIYARATQGRKAGTVRPVFIFVSKVRYRTRLQFFKVAERVIQREFPSHFDREFEIAMRTAL